MAEGRRINQSLLSLRRVFDARHALLVQRQPLKNELLRQEGVADAGVEAQLLRDGAAPRSRLLRHRGEGPMGH